jgi:hypothetical protein
VDDARFVRDDSDMGPTKHRPLIPREEPEEDEPRSGPPTVRPPPAAHPSASIASYQQLRESCRVQTVADEDQLDDELAVEAEVLRVALDRRSRNPKPNE